MTNQNPNQTEETAVVPQRTFAQWMVHCQAVVVDVPINNLMETLVFPSDIRWENDALMVFDLQIYDLKTQSTDELAIQEGIDAFLSTINNEFAKYSLTSCLNLMDVTSV